MDAYNEIFKIGTKFDKDPPFYSSPPLLVSYFPIPSTKIALTRKAMHSPHFSKESIRRSEHLITDMLAKFLKILSGYASGAKPVDLSLGLRSLTSDVSMNYSFQRPFNTLDVEGFHSDVLEGVAGLTGMMQWPGYFPNFFAGVFWMIELLPGWFVSKSLKPYALVNWCLEASREQITYLQKRSPSEGEIRTVFDINLNPNLEKGQFTPTVDEMAADAFALLTAGTDTSAYAMMTVIWHLLNNPQMMQRLKAELRRVMPGREDTVDWAVLEKLPYLVNEKKRAVIKEGLRLSYGAPGRLPRVVPSSGAVFCGQKIPAGIRVSSSAYVHHQDPHTFKDPQTYRPERWLEDSTDGDRREMEKKFIPFSRGSRSCIGLNLAYAEIYLILAHLFRRFEISNAGTTDADMEWDDSLVAVIRGHLKVTVRESVE
ncbi:MAG: hypothetical protein Q9161_000994 [Pseudevernia consocians]